MAIGTLLVLLAALCQGTFLLPMAAIRNWSWEHTWAAFSLLAMFVFNWAIAWSVLPNPISIYAHIPRQDLFMLALFGACWGFGAVLFGIGMDKLGLALGYPLIMGINAAAGALIPMLGFSQASLLSIRSAVIYAGIAVSICGVALCSVASTRKANAANTLSKKHLSAVGLLIGILAGCLSSLPNIGLAYGKSVIEAAKALGAAPYIAGNAVWVVFLSVGSIVNVVYCGVRIAWRHNFSIFTARHGMGNLAWAAVMAILWIGSLYIYGAGASRMGNLGASLAWPILTSVSIGVGSISGIWKGEWSDRSASARRLLLWGLLLITIAVCILAFGNRI